MKELIIKTKHNKITIPDKNDIIEALEEKADDTDLANVAKTGSYNDLANKVTKTSQLTNDGSDGTHPFLTEHQNISGKENTSNKSSSITTDTGSTTKYPTVKAVEDYAQPKGNYLTEHQNISGKVNIAQGSANASKNVVTNSSGNITTEPKPTIPSASTTTPKADTANGSAGGSTTTTWSKSDHVHPKSDIYNVTITKENSPNTNAFATYTIKQNNTQIGQIDIPKDFLVKSGSVKTAKSSDLSTLGSGYAVNDKYIDLVINTTGSSTDEHLYIKVQDLVESRVLYSQTGSGTIEIGRITIDGVETIIKQQDNNTTYTAATLKDPNAHTGKAINTDANAYQTAINTALDTAIAGKVDKVNGKGLSTNDYTTTEKNKLAGLDKITKTSELTNDGDGTNAFSTTSHNHSGIYVDGITTKNTTNGTAIAAIKANSTEKGTIYHPKVSPSTATASTTIGSGRTFTTKEPDVNTDGHVTKVTTRTYTIPEASTDGSGLMTATQVTTLNNKISKISNNTNFLFANGSNAATISKSKINDFPTSMTPTSHTDINGNYGKATTSVYGHTILVDNLTTDANDKALTAKQGKALKDLIGEAITYINR